MFDIQASFVRDVILGHVTLPDVEIMDQDIEQWKEKEKKLEYGNGKSEFYYQINYMQDLLTQCHSPPQFDINRVILGVEELVKHKIENVFTYRDHTFASIVTGKKEFHGNIHKSWLNNFADAKEEFFSTITLGNDNTVDDEEPAIKDVIQ
ncbi:unnamed protein product [Adineta ricciae]|nr:unnamed protein product [Adineta ricciae]